jgi:putative phosphoesterase
MATGSRSPSDPPAARPPAAPVRVGIISDTHGLLRPEALAALAGVDRIVHAGDIGDGAILRRLREIAPVTAVRGNNDTGTWASSLPELVDIDVAGVRVRVIHDLKELARRPQLRFARVVVSGHSHRPLVREQDGVLYVNPGSAGPRRFSWPVALAQLTIEHRMPHARITELRLTRSQ